MKTLLLFVFAASLIAQPPPTFTAGQTLPAASLNTGFQGLYTGKIGRWAGAGTPGDFPFSVIGDLYFNTSSQGSVYGCYKVHCTAVGASNWVLVSGGGVGTVTSVGLSRTNDTNINLSLGGANPVTSSGTISLILSWAGTLSVARGGTGTATPGLVQGSNITITGTWPNQTISASGGGGSGCTPGGTSGQILVSDGAGGCNATTPTISGSTITASLTGNASTASALSANPTDCGSNAFAIAIAANGNLTCAAPFVLTTTGSSGAATYTGGTLNIPQYTSGGTPISGATVNAIVTAASATTIQTAAPTATMDSSGNISTPGTVSVGVGSGVAGASDLGAGTVPAVPANSFGWGAGTTMTTSQRLQSPNAVASAHSLMVIGAPSSNISPWAYKVVPDCATDGAHAITFTQSTDTWNCTAVTGGGGSSTTQGTYASLPGTCTTGDLYFITDSPISQARCSATNTWTFFVSGLGAVTPPALGSFTWVNQSTATANNTYGMLTIVAQTSGNAFNINALVKSIPSTPYHIIACFTRTMQAITNDQVGLVFRNSSSGKMMVFGGYQAVLSQYVTFYASDATTYGGSTPVNNNSPQPMGPYLCLRIGDDGTTNRTYDAGTNPHTFFEAGNDARTSQFTADQIGFFVNGTGQEMNILHYTETN